VKIAAGQVYIGDIPATELAERFGTPLYALDAEEIARRYRRFVADIAYRPLHVRYAIKANANVGVMRYLRELGAALDACSPGDLAFADAAGFGPDDVFYTGCAISDNELRQVAARGVFFNADSLSQLARYGRYAPGRPVGLRINTGVVAGFHAHVRSGGLSSKFGLHPAQMPEALAIAARHGLRVVALHTHLGSDIFEPAAPLAALDVLVAVAEPLSALTLIDVGGGWGVPFMAGDPEFDMATYGAGVTARLGALSARRGREIAFHVEPGAYLLSDAGVLLTRVTELKPPVLVHSELTPFFAGTDTSYNAAVSTVLYGSYHGLYVADRAEAASTHTYDVVGHLMQAGDVLARGRPLPELREGDLLVMLNCGSYAASRAPQFNERPRPAEVLVQGSQARLVRRAEGVADLLSHQVMQ